jgi:hypothetical protein
MAKRTTTSNPSKLANKKKAKRAQKKADREAQFPDSNGIDPTYIRPAATVFSAREFVDWMYLQDACPNPLRTNREVICMRFEAANTGVSRRQFKRHLEEVMRLWREDGDPESAYTEQNQSDGIALAGANMTVPVITITWEQFQRERQPAQAGVSNVARAEFSAAAIATTSNPPVAVASDTADASLVAYYLAYPYPESHG